MSMEALNEFVEWVSGNKSSAFCACAVLGKIALYDGITPICGRENCSILGETFSISLSFVSRLCPSNTYRQVPGRMWVQALSSFCQAHVFEVLTPTSTYHQFIIYILYLSKFQSKQDFVFKYHILHFCLYNANGIFKSWLFYCSRPFAGNKQSVHIISFPVGHTR